jgi:hypothetical protein
MAAVSILDIEITSTIEIVFPSLWEVSSGRTKITGIVADERIIANAMLE